MKFCKADKHFLEEVDNYTELSYLRKSEITHIYGRFKELGEEVAENLQHRFEKSRILQTFPELSFNPFVDRIFHVFSSLKDEKMSFEDILDLASAFSEDCPVVVKAQWAFLIFDFDGDELLNQNDIAEIVTRLTKSRGNTSEEENCCLTATEIKKVTEIVRNFLSVCNNKCKVAQKRETLPKKNYNNNVVDVSVDMILTFLTLKQVGQKRTGQRLHSPVSPKNIRVKSRLPGW